MSGSPTALINGFLEAVAAFGPALHQPLHQELRPFLEQQEASQGMDAYLSQVAAAVSPRHACYSRVYALNPYANPDIIRANVQGAAERGWLTLEEHGFAAAPKALAFTEDLSQLLKDHLAEREIGLAVDIPRMVELLEPLVEAARTIEVISYKPNVEFSHHHELADKTPSLLLVRRYLITIGAYRDDSHIAAWMGHSLPGFMWEAFTFVWQGKAATAAALADKLSTRGYSHSDYSQALRRLAKRGWLEFEDGHFDLTEAGRQVRQAAEDTTNDNYRAIFSVLTAAELQELVDLLNALTEAVAIREVPQPA